MRRVHSKQMDIKYTGSNALEKIQKSIHINFDISSYI